MLPGSLVSLLLTLGLRNLKSEVLSLIQFFGTIVCIHLYSEYIVLPVVLYCTERAETTGRIVRRTPPLYHTEPGFQIPGVLWWWWIHTYSYVYITFALFSIHT